MFGYEHTVSDLRNANGRMKTMEREEEKELRIIEKQKKKGRQKVVMDLREKKVAVVGRQERETE